MTMSLRSIGCLLLVSVAVAASSPPQSESVASSDGVSVAYETRGEGRPALVFVHGWSCDRGYWAGQLDRFAEQYRVVAVDLGGHGESSRGTRTSWTMAAFGADVAAVADALGLERMVLVGHSMGGDVIVEAARRLKGRVAGLIWVDTYRQLGTVRTPEQLQAMSAPFRDAFARTTREFVRGMFPPDADRALVERIAEDMASAPPAVAVSALEAAMGYDRHVPAALKELNLPVIAINPDYRPTDVPSMKRHGVDVMILPGVGHFLMMEAPERFNRLLEAAVGKVSPP